MPKLANIANAMNQTAQKERSALERSFGKSVLAPTVAEIRRLEQALSGSLDRLEREQSTGSGKAVNAVQDASQALRQGLESLLTHVSGLEAQILAEIRAIRIPEPEKADLSPILSALENLPKPEKVEIPAFPEMPEFPEIPKPKAIVPVRYSSSSSMHPLVERYELEY